MAQPNYSTLEVDPNFYHAGLEVSPKQPPTTLLKPEGQPGQGDYNAAGYSHYGAAGYANEEGNKEVVGQGRKRICGMTVMWFWIAIVVAVLVIGAAVGGGVGGSLASKSSNSAAVPVSSTSSSSSSTSASSTSTSTSTSTTSTSTTTSVNPTATSFVCPGQNGTNYISNANGVATVFKRYCNTNAPFNDLNYNGNAKDLPQLSFSACMDYCVSFGERCIGVIHDTSQNNGIDNCWLKSKLALPWVRDNTSEHPPQLAQRL